MHARCWPFATNDKNLLKLASETVLMLVFLTTAVLRSALAKLDLVDAGLLKEDDLTSEERQMPRSLSVFMVVVTCTIPIATLVYNHCVYKHRTSKSNGSEEEDIVCVDNSVQGTYTTILLAKHTHRIRLFARGLPWYYYDKIRLRLERSDPYSVILFQKQQRVRG